MTEKPSKMNYVGTSDKSQGQQYIHFIKIIF